MAVAWGRAFVWGRRITALVLGVPTVGLPAAFAVEGVVRGKWAEAGLLAVLSAVFLVTAVGIWQFPRRRWLLALGLLSIPLTILSVFWAFGSFSYETLLEPGFVGLSIAVVVFALSALAFGPKVAAQLNEARNENAQVAAADKSSPLQRIWAERSKVSRGSYIAAGLWALALIFVMIESAAFVGNGGGVLAFFSYLLTPVMILFVVDWLIGKRQPAP